ncbi:MAG: hypothetical protein OQK82_02315 [Candidatus Pacearchaeota archaeon]|nr:hypothetical protein [Candidatus Pacearchaeota archaeon]
MPVEKIAIEYYSNEIFLKVHISNREEYLELNPDLENIAHFFYSFECTNHSITINTKDLEGNKRNILNKLFYSAITNYDSQ